MKTSFVRGVRTWQDDQPFLIYLLRLTLNQQSWAVSKPIPFIILQTHLYNWWILLNAAIPMEPTQNLCPTSYTSIKPFLAFSSYRNFPLPPSQLSLEWTDQYNPDAWNLFFKTLVLASRFILFKAYYSLHPCLSTVFPLMDVLFKITQKPNSLYGIIVGDTPPVFRIMQPLKSWKEFHYPNIHTHPPHHNIYPSCLFSLWNKISHPPIHFDCYILTTSPSQERSPQRNVKFSLLCLCRC